MALLHRASDHVPVEQRKRCGQRLPASLSQQRSTPTAAVLEIGVLTIIVLEIDVLAIAVLEISVLAVLEIGVLYTVDHCGVVRLLARSLEGAEQCRLHLLRRWLPLMFFVELVEELLEGCIIRMLLLRRRQRWGWWWRRWGWWWGWRRWRCWWRRCTAWKGPGRVA
jgi:hypothetical protein